VNHKPFSRLIRKDLEASTLVCVVAVANNDGKIDSCRNSSGISNAESDLSLYAPLLSYANGPEIGGARLGRTTLCTNNLSGGVPSCCRS
jgi:hypothetical protein